MEARNKEKCLSHFMEMEIEKIATKFSSKVSLKTFKNS